MMTTNLCIKHFPEPIIYISEEPMCKKCIPEYLEKMKKKGNKDQDKDEHQTDKLAQLFGNTQANAFASEKNMITNCLIKLEDFRGDFRYINEEIDDRVIESN